MTESKGRYAAATPQTVTAFRNRPCSRSYASGEYEPPTPEEVTALVQLAGWSQRQVAEITGARFDPRKGSTTVRKWRTPKGKPEHREIPYSAWRLLLLHAGVVTFEEEQAAADGSR